MLESAMTYPFVSRRTAPVRRSPPAVVAENVTDPDPLVVEAEDEALEDLAEEDGVLEELDELVVAELTLALLAATPELAGPNGLMTKITIIIAAIKTAAPMIMPTMRPVFEFFCGCPGAWG